jgi:hypothetical protein
MIVKVKDNVVSEPVTMDIPQTNVKLETLVERDNVDVNVRFFWDSHGTLVSFPGGPNEERNLSRLGVSVKVVKKTYTQMGQDWESWLLYINGERISGEVEEYTFKGKKSTVLVVIGWG